MSARYEIRRSSDRQYYFNLKAGNGEVILTSERYVTKSGAENGIASCRVNSPHDVMPFSAPNFSVRSFRLISPSQKILNSMNSSL